MIDSGSSSHRPLPAEGRPKPTLKRNVPQIPKVQALYDYAAQDTDEISLSEGEVLELIKEGEWSKGLDCMNSISLKGCFFSDESGWWTGKNSKGMEGFFPGTYVQKL